MKSLARHIGPESYAVGGNVDGVATAGVRLGPVIELRDELSPACRHFRLGGRQYHVDRHGEIGNGRGGVKDLEHGRKLQTREPGDPIGPSELVTDGDSKTPREVQRV